MKYKIATYNTSNSICAINKSVLLFFDLLEVDASTLEPRSVLFYELLSSFFLKNESIVFNLYMAIEFQIKL